MCRQAVSRHFQTIPIVIEQTVSISKIDESLVGRLGGGRLTKATTQGGGHMSNLQMAVG